MSIPSRTLPAARDERWLALAVLCAGTLMIVLDATIVNVALPAIQRDFGFSQSSLAWVVNAYLIAFGGVLLLAGRLGDLLGRRRIFLVGLTVFTLASLVCGLSPSGPVLIASRFIQGLGGAMTSAVILGMIVTMFTEPQERTRAISLYSFVAAAGASIGLLAGGVLTELLDWHWIFFVNVPIGIVTGILAVRLIKDDAGLGLGKGADAPGAILVTAALMLGVLTIIRTSDVGWFSIETLVGAVATALVFAAFVVREHRTSDPLLPLRILRSRAVAGANLIMVLVVAGFFGTFFIGSLYLERVLRFDALAIGAGLPPHQREHRRDVLRVLRAPDHEVRATRRAPWRPGPAARRDALAGAAARGCDLPGRCRARSPAHRHRRRTDLPVDRRARDVGGHQRRRGTGVRPREHDPDGRRLAGPRGDGVTADHSRRDARDGGG